MHLERTHILTQRRKGTHHLEMSQTQSNNDFDLFIAALGIANHAAAFREEGLDDIGDVPLATGEMLADCGLDAGEVARFLAAAAAEDPLAAATAATAAAAAAATAVSPAAEDATTAPASAERDELEAWLRETKLASYVEPLLSAGLAMGDVPALTDARLRDLGVLKAMHRKRFVRAGKALAAVDAAKAAPPAPEAEAEEASSKHASEPAKDVLPMVGLSLGAMRKLVRDGRLHREMTTEQLCHEVLMPDTTPAGWTLSSAKTPEGWTLHSYRNNATGEEIRERQQNQAPAPGTRTFCDLLVERGEGASVGRANRFVSHAWMLKFMEVFLALEAGLLSKGALVKVDGLASEQGMLLNGNLGSVVRYDSGKDRYLVQLRGEEGQQKLLKVESLLPMHDEETEVFLWFDVCTINEHQPERVSKGFSEKFMEAVGRIGHTLLVLTPFDQPMVLSRSWCLWEVFCTHKKECQLTICLPDTERRILLAESISSFSAVQDAFGKIDSSNARAGAQKDQDKIAEAIEASVGFQELDSLIFARLRGWAQATVDAAAAEALSHAGGRLTTKEALFAAFASAKEMSIQGKHQQAASIWPEVIAGFEACFDLSNVMQSKFNYCQSLLNLDRLDEASVTIQQVVDFLQGLDDADDLRRNDASYERVYDDHHHYSDEKLVLVDAKQMHARVLMKQGRLHEAAAVFLDVFTAKTAALGPDHVTTVKAKNDYAVILQQQRQFDEAAILFREIVASSTSLKGVRHPETLSSKGSLASCIHMQCTNAFGASLKPGSSHREKLAEAAELFEEVIAGLLATMGADHNATLEIQGTYAIVLEVLGRLQEATDVYQQVILAQTDLFGAAHTSTLLTKMNLGVLCNNKTGDVDMAKFLFEQVVSGFTQTLGAQHPHSQAAMRNLARVSDVYFITNTPFHYR